MLFLIQGTVQFHGYMRDRADKPRPIMRIVEADDEEAAKEKFIKHYDRSIPHDDSYYVSIDECEGVLV